MKKIFKTVISFCLLASLMLSAVGCAWINETILGKEHAHKFKDFRMEKEPTCTEEGKQIATCKCGAIEVTVLDATGAHNYVGKTCTTCGRNDPTGLSEAVLCGDALSSYVIVYDANASAYTVRAAEYIAKEIQNRTGLTLSVIPVTAESALNAHEIVVGETARPISETLNAETEGLEFALLANEDHIALEGDYFIIAAAAYYFVEKYIPEKIFDIDLPTTATVCTPIVKEAENFILLIGDGMGLNQTKLFEAYQSHEVTDYSDGENFFYGNLFPYIGEARTDSLSGTTDSAAAGTALASGYKTENGTIGRDADQNDVPLLTELAAGKGRATAVMSTEKQTGATPSAFSAHAYHRSNTTAIKEAQMDLIDQYGTIIDCGYDVYSNEQMANLRTAITDTLAELSEDEDGFFLMYEEAYIDKHCSSLDVEKAYMAMVRFNQAIALFMEYAFYNPETMVIITADHETGGLHLDEDGKYQFVSEDHTSTNVPVFAYGARAEIFDGKTVENVQIAKTIAALFGVSIEGTDPQNYPALTPLIEIKRK